MEAEPIVFCTEYNKLHVHVHTTDVVLRFDVKLVLRLTLPAYATYLHSCRVCYWYGPYGHLKSCTVHTIVHRISQYRTCQSATLTSTLVIPVPSRVLTRSMRDVENT
eukprot:scpid67222/ scgid15360/ 